MNALCIFANHCITDQIPKQICASARYPPDAYGDGLISKPKSTRLDWLSSDVLSPCLPRWVENRTPL